MYNWKKWKCKLEMYNWKNRKDRQNGTKAIHEKRITQNFLKQVKNTDPQILEVVKVPFKIKTKKATRKSITVTLVKITRENIKSSWGGGEVYNKGVISKLYLTSQQKQQKPEDSEWN